MPSVLDEIRVIDADTHLPEPPDLWTSRLPKAWGDRVPHVRWDDRTNQDCWFIGDQLLIPVAQFAYTGWSEFPPGHPPTWAEADPKTWDVKQRLARMDEEGIYAQVLYPNVALFNSAMLQNTKNPEIIKSYILAYNDFQTDWSSAAPDRLLPMASLPFWDLDATLKELARCRSLGHRGIVFTQEPAAFGLPGLMDRHWDPLWAAAQEAGMPVNFHVASTGNIDIAGLGLGGDGGGIGQRATLLPILVQQTANDLTITKLIAGGICHRFPELNFVSVESGVGWIPYLLDLLDFGWSNFGINLEHPEYDLLPSEYFKRQILSCFMFEESTARYAIERLGADSLLYETDFPHPGSFCPGPVSDAPSPAEYLGRLSDIPTESLHKILHGNAARIYHLDD